MTCLTGDKLKQKKRSDGPSSIFIQQKQHDITCDKTSLFME